MVFFTTKWVYISLCLKVFASHSVDSSPMMDATSEARGAISYMSPRAIIDKVEPVQCGNQPVDVACSTEKWRNFTKPAGKEATAAFCGFLHAEGGGVFLNQLYPIHAHSKHTASGIFDLQAECERCIDGRHQDFNFVIEKNYDDCKASFNTLIDQCRLRPSSSKFRRF
jgi:hypothetical protein